MEAESDKFWLLGNPSWWDLNGENPPDFMKGELAPPHPWVSTTPRIGNFGWCRQRLRPLAWSLLRTIAWAPFFLAASSFPLAFPGNTINDQVVSIALFSLFLLLLFFPIFSSRNSQPTPVTSIRSLPIDWPFFMIASMLFPLHILHDPRIGWVSYALFWVAFFRTTALVQKSMMAPCSRFLLPIDRQDWEGVLPDPWRVLSKQWSRRELANADFENGSISLSGTSRSGQDFLAISFVHKSGFVIDPFHYNTSKEEGLTEFLASPIPIVGRQWPTNLLLVSEEE